MYKLEEKTIEGLSPLIVNSDNDTARIYPKGYTKQEGEPTPENFIKIQNAENNLNIIIENIDKTLNKTFDFPLSEGQKLYKGSYLTDDGIHHIRKQIEIDENIEFVVSTMNEYQWFEINEEGVKQGSTIVCNYLKDYISVGDYVGISNDNTANKVFLSISKEITNIEQLKEFLIQKKSEGNPFIIEYELTEEIIEPYTEEQKEVINNIKIFEGYNNILATSENNNLEITLQYKPQLTKEIMQAFLTNKTYGYINIIDTGEVINYDNYLKNIKLDDLKYVPDKGIFGGAIAKRVVLEFNNEAGKIKIENKEFDLYIGVNYKDEYYYIKYGRFIVQKPNTETTTDNTSFSALDYMTKFNEPYVDKNVYPCTLRKVAENLCIGTGLKLSSKHFRNEDFIVENNQFVSGESKRQVAQAIALSAFSWARVNEDNELCFDLENKRDFDIEINSDNYYNLSKNDELFGPLNRIVIRNSQIEGENVTIQDNESIEKYGVNELVIEDNPFAYTQAKRTQLIEAGKELYGFNYMPINNANLTGYLFLNCLDRIRFKDINNNTFDTYIFDHTIDYNGISLDTISTKAMTKTQTKYTYIPSLEQAQKRTEINVDKQNQTINALVTSNTELVNKTSKLEIDVDSIKGQISEIADVTVTADGYGVINVENINESEPILVKIYPISEDIIPLRPRKGLYPRVGLRPHSRELIFTRTNNQDEPYSIEYNIPADLYKLENQHDEFILDYENQRCYINRVVGINEDGEKYLLEVPKTEEFEYPILNLLEGDYKIYMPAFENAYIYVRLMTKNLYTSQFATKVELNSKIEQTSTNIELSVNQKLKGYSTTQEMNSAISIASDNITSSVAKTYATKSELTIAKSEIKITTDNIISTVSKKVGKNEVISTINQSAESILINASKVNLSGYVTITNLKTAGKTTINGSNITTGTIDANKVTVKNLNASNITSGTLSASKISGGSLSLTGNNTSITSTNFSVTKDGVITAKSGTLGGWKIDSASISKTTGQYNLEIRSDRPANEAAILVWDTKSQGYNFYIRPDGFLYAKNADISGNIKATSGSISGSLITSGFSASNITAGRLNISDGSGHYLRMGFSEGDNPSVSGLNVMSYGIDMHQHGISNCTDIGFGGSVWTFDRFSSAITTQAYVRFPGSSYVYIGDRTLSQYVNDVVQSYLN